MIFHFLCRFVISLHNKASQNCMLCMRLLARQAYIPEHVSVWRKLLFITSMKTFSTRCFKTHASPTRVLERLVKNSLKK